MATSKKIQYYWWVVLMAFIATALSFLDRQVLSVVIVKIKEELTIDDTAYGIINTGFLISYAIMFTLGGALIDYFGSRKGLAISVGIWSFASALHGMATSVWHFASFRFLLGLGEGGAFPGAIRAVVEWVPKHKQALANGIAIGGAALGAVIAPPLCVQLIKVMGWRGIFVVTGIIGLIWIIIWLWLPKLPQQREEDSERTKKDSRGLWIDLGHRLSLLFKIRDVWVFILIRFFLDPIFYFYMFWIPKYLSEFRGVSFDKIGSLFWIPFLMLGISNILGGYLSDYLLNKSKSLNIARKSVMGLAAILTIPAVFVQYVSTAEMVILIMSIVFFAHGLWITNYITAISDIFGRSITSTVVGVSGTAGALSALIVNPLMGIIISSFSYDPLWIYAGVMYGVAFAGFMVFIPRIKARQDIHLPQEM